MNVVACGGIGAAGDSGRSQREEASPSETWNEEIRRRNRVTDIARRVAKLNLQCAELAEPNGDLAPENAALVDAPPFGRMKSSES
ncbi:jg14068 [Pararge aegeria aegeria]|uniref:Jg14068 protein n=1 Tax=Pararge aegeria aegeria TaxID=348720 RepID=A0A8S4SPY7_9NEOP|nr:jg14068 [Pararge aegeria aegeria]